MESKRNSRMTVSIHMNQSMTEYMNQSMTEYASFIMICILVYTCNWNIRYYVLHY